MSWGASADVSVGAGGRSLAARRGRSRMSRVHPFLGRRAPLAFAHRGGAAEAPENTLEAFGAAVALGCRYLETDVQLTRDGVLVACHDERLDHVSDRRGAIADLPIAEIETADAGYRFHDRRRAHVPVP